MIADVKRNKIEIQNLTLIFHHRDRIHSPLKENISLQSLQKHVFIEVEAVVQNTIIPIQLATIFDERQINNDKKHSAVMLQAVINSQQYST